MEEQRFRDRREAGHLLVTKLTGYADRADVLVLALPRGGVPVAFEVARALHAPLDVIIVRKLGVPGREELAMGAIASGGVRVLNDDVVQRLGIPEELIHTVAEREQQELERRERLYRGDRPAYDGNVGQQAVIVDDVLDTGGTLVSCCEQLQQRGVPDITILVTHGLFTGTLWQQLWTFQVKRVSCTDTIPWGKERPDENIGTLSVLPLLSQYLQARS